MRRRPDPLATARPALAALALAAASLAAPSTASAQEMADGPDEVPTATRVAGAVLALPEEARTDAEVRAADGETVLRQGDGQMICLADAPGDGRFRVSCYHRSLEPFMAMGRQLRADGVEGMAYQEARWKAADAGRLSMPATPAMVYNLSFPSEDLDPATADWRAGSRLHALYVPWANAATTGLPTDPAGGGPWLMWPGEASAHVMISLPPADDGGEG